MHKIYGLDLIKIKQIEITVKPVKNGHSKIDKTKVFMTNEA